MSHSTNQKTYDSLLSKFVESDVRWEEHEEKQMEQWLTEAEKSLRNRPRNDHGE